jgi:hypothetical protein
MGLVWVGGAADPPRGGGGGGSNWGRARMRDHRRGFMQRETPGGGLVECAAAVDAVPVALHQPTPKPATSAESENILLVRDGEYSH